MDEEQKRNARARDVAHRLMGVNVITDVELHSISLVQVTVNKDCAVSVCFKDRSRRKK